jgi:3-dehydroquinate synthase
MKKITVNASKTYDIVIASGLIDFVGDQARKTVGGKSAAVVTDDVVDRFCGDRLLKSLTAAGYRTVKFTLKNGEASKNAENYIALLNFLAEEHFTRSDVVFALGGGVVGDLAGFAAATYMRGCRFVQLPTTLLAAVDSSVGGKTAIDLHAGKNLAGSFYQPDLVLCDHSLLSTLPEEVFLDGCAEVIKYGVIADKELFEQLRKPIGSQLEEIIAKCVSIKRYIVGEDEYETGMRKLLNFGHTVGHAIEACSRYAISHGKAVAAGMAVISRACARMGICSTECSRDIIGMLERYRLPVTCAYSPQDLAHAALSDKKRNGDSLTIVVPRSVGRCVLQEISSEEFEHFISLGLESNEDTL